MFCFFVRNGGISPSVKATPQFETQEIWIDFKQEPLGPYLNRQMVENAEQSVIDSGVGNTSVPSDSDPKNSLHSIASDTDGRRSSMRLMPDELSASDTDGCRSSMRLMPDGLSVDGEGPVMTSSPMVSRELQHVVEASTDKVNTDRSELTDNATINGARKGKKGDSLLLLDGTGESETDDELDNDVNTENNAGDLIVEDIIPNKHVGENLVGSNGIPIITVAKDADDSIKGNENIAAIEITSF